MDPVGMTVVALVLLVGAVGGLWWKRSDGRLRAVAPATVAAVAAQPVDNGRKLSDPVALLLPTQNGVGAGGGVVAARTATPVDNDRSLSDPAALVDPTPDGVGTGAAGVPLDAAMLAGLGVDPGERATLLQFSSAYCAPCRAVSRISAEVAREVPGVRHVEVDAEEHLDAVKALGIWRTPTLLVLDRAGRVVKRATGVPKKPHLIALMSDYQTVAESGA